MTSFCVPKGCRTNRERKVRNWMKYLFVNATGSGRGAAETEMHN